MPVKQYEIAREYTPNAASVWWLVFLQPSGKWIIERRWRNFDPAKGTAIASGTERLPIEAFEASPAGRRFANELRETLDKATQDA